MGSFNKIKLLIKLRSDIWKKKSELEDVMISYSALQTIMQKDLHQISEDMRVLYSITFMPNLKEKLDKMYFSISRYLDRIARIARTLFLEYEQELSEEILNNYAACIKIIHPDDLREDS